MYKRKPLETSSIYVLPTWLTRGCRTLITSKYYAKSQTTRNELTCKTLSYINLLIQLVGIIISLGRGCILIIQKYFIQTNSKFQHTYLIMDIHARTYTTSYIADKNERNKIEIDHFTNQATTRTNLKPCCYFLVHGSVRLISPIN